MTITVAAIFFPPPSAAPQTPTPAVAPEQALRYWESLPIERRQEIMAKFVKERVLCGNDSAELTALMHKQYGPNPVHDDAVGGTWLTEEQAAQWAREIWADLLTV